MCCELPHEFLRHACMCVRACARRQVGRLASVCWALTRQICMHACMFVRIGRWQEGSVWVARQASKHVGR